MLYAFAITQVKTAVAQSGIGTVTDWRIDTKQHTLFHCGNAVAKLIWIANGFAIDPTANDLSTCEVDKLIITTTPYNIDVKDVEIDLTGEANADDINTRYYQIPAFIRSVRNAVLEDYAKSHDFLVNRNKLYEYQNECRPILIRFCNAVMNGDQKQMVDTFNSIKMIYEKHFDLN